jgi:hypothetical protein
MAIMWDPPAEHPTIEPTPAERAWRQWLMQTLVANSTAAQLPTAIDDKAGDARTPAA